ncbi:Large ribosomal subunit protein uL4c [Cardamine amara subsp. amara]|uniref:Large ribosomal subunit protein uL4m n=1 Tax=Cardamine amara subsp. amara TaxID=228776 RepID=A0ABD1ASH7_CARAN
MQSIRGGTKLLQRHHFSISNTLRSTSASSSWSANESRRLGFDSFRSTRAFDSAATYLISSLTKAVPSSSVVPYGMSLLSNRKLSTLTPDSSDDAIPSDLLMKKTVITPDWTIGKYQDLVIPVTNFQNEEKGLMVLSGDVFDVPIRKDIIHNVVKWQLAKRQQGTHSTKTLSEVSGTGRKPWNQKGTGRARHGTLRGPQFRGGCVMHGPKSRSHAIKMNKQVRRLGLKIALSARAAEGKLLVFDDLALPSHKTKNIVNYYNQMENTKKVLVVEGGPIDEKLKLATQNLHYVNIIPSIGLNVYSILLHDTLVMSRDAVNMIVERMNTPINR